MAVALTAAALLCLPAVSAAAQTDPALGPAETASGGDHTVTLVTGDKVKARLKDHDVCVLSVEPGEGRAGVTFAITDRGDQVSVVPSDAAPLIRANRLDPRLFEVGTLIADGYDDEHSRSIPIMTTYGRSMTTQNADRAGVALGQAAKRRKESGQPISIV
ncbi:hypothetical protein [Streptosporangium sp. NPDC003464]